MAAPATGKPRFFATPAAFRAWLARHHATADVLWVGLHKRGTGRPSITWPEAVDEALCFGWIDGVRRSLDEHSYVIRFTPRRAKSVWSVVNLRRAKALERSGRMTDAGRAALAARDAKRSGVYSFEQRRAGLGPAYERRLRANAAAWRFYQAQPPWYRRTTGWWVMSARREETRQRRLATLIADCAAGRWIRGLARPARRAVTATGVRSAAAERSRSRKPS